VAKKIILLTFTIHGNERIGNKNIRLVPKLNNILMSKKAEFKVPKTAAGPDNKREGDMVGFECPVLAFVGTKEGHDSNRNNEQSRGS
jgi:hypothetical protein